jgi:hypothetical protein
MTIERYVAESIAHIIVSDESQSILNDDGTIARHVANEEQLLSVLSTAEQEKLNALLRKLIAGL